jgi:hypothetical protein
VVRLVVGDPHQREVGVRLLVVTVGAAGSDAGQLLLARGFGTLVTTGFAPVPLGT